MKVYYRECLDDYKIKAENGDILYLNKGQEYVTSSVEDGKITVFTKYWVEVPFHLFGEGKEKPRETGIKTSSSTVFRRELEVLINKNNMEIGSNTPDYILAEYLTNCLNAFDLAVRQREMQKENLK